MYPHERSLVARMKGKPFALIGVNSDRDKAKLKSRMKEENITWRSFWNGPQGTGGPISKAWGVRGWPTIYVIDHEGVIRYKGVRGEAMDEAVDDLMKKVSGGKVIHADEKIFASHLKTSTPLLVDFYADW